MSNYWLNRRATRDLVSNSLGEFEVTSGVLRVSDPCYERDTWCAGTIEPAIEGYWTAQAVIFNEGSWGNRVGYLIVQHKDYNFDLTDSGWSLENIDVGVDSGQAGVFDDRYYRDDDVVKHITRKHSESICEDDPWYSICCDRTLCDEQAGVIPHGAVSSSGYGDGSYRCLTQKDENDNIIAVMIDFGLSEEDEEDE